MLEEGNRRKRIILGYVSHPSARAPDHCRRKPRAADIRMVAVLLGSHLNDSTPGGSSHGIRASKKKTVIGVVFHINLHSKEIVVYRGLSDINLLVRDKSPD